VGKICVLQFGIDQVGVLQIGKREIRSTNISILKKNKSLEGTKHTAANYFAT
jgi:hypothetical protein